MTLHHHDVTGAPARAVQLMVRLYPWSVLWVMLAAVVSLVSQGLWSVLGLIVTLVSLLAWQTVHTEHLGRPRRSGRHR